MIRYCALSIRTIVDDVTEDEEKVDIVHVYVRDIYENFISPKRSIRITKKLNERFLHKVENDEHG